MIVTFTWRRAWTSGLAVQALGPLCGFATVLLIARLGGVADQGRFAQVKAWVDLLVVAGCFGFPQGFVFVINKLGTSAARLGWTSLAYSAAFFPAAWLASRWLASRWQVHDAAWVPALAAALLVLHGLWRGVFLSVRRGIPFAVFTVAPAVALLVSVAVGMGMGAAGPGPASVAPPARPAPANTAPANTVSSSTALPSTVSSSVTSTSVTSSIIATAGTASANLVTATARAGSGRWSFEAMYLLSALPAVAVAAMWMAPVLRAQNRGPAAPLPWRALLSNGSHVFIQALLTVLQPLLAYGLLRRAGAGDVGVGLLNVGVFLVQGASVPIGLVAPLLFARWTSAGAASPIARLDAMLDARGGRWTRIGAALGVALALLVAAWVPFVFGATYREAQMPAALMMLTLPAACHARLLAPALHASGQPMQNTLAAALRVATVGLLGAGLTAAGADPLLAVAVAWTVAEGLAAMWSFAALRRLARGGAAA